jgi:N6-adenosine-specific RNA methylase IME4
MFELIMADPPWEFRNVKTGGSHSSGAAQKYDTMPLAAIQGLPVQSVRASKSVLALWVPTTLKFSHGGSVLAAWGFRYVTTVYWEKIRKGKRLGMGHWFRNEVEELLIAVHGDVAPFRCQLPNIIHAPVEDHSAKPEAFRQLLEQATGQISRRRNLELFARRTVPGWTGIGNQVTGRDVRDDLRRLAGAAA